MGRRKEIPLNGVKAKLALLWQNNTNEWKQYYEIRNHLKSFPEFKKISERTIIRYINQLCTEGFLEKRIELTHRTWYKPGHEALIPILFNIKAQNWVFGLKPSKWDVKTKDSGALTLKQSFENEFADMPVETRLQTIARRFFAYGLFCCLQTLKTQNNAWLEASSFSLTPKLLAQLGLPLKVEMEMQPVGEYKGNLILKSNSLMIYQLPEQEFEDKIKSVFPNEYHELQKILEEISKAETNAERTRPAASSRGDVLKLE